LDLAACRVFGRRGLVAGDHMVDAKQVLGSPAPPDCASPTKADVIN